MPEIPNICYIFNSWWFKDVKNDNPKCPKCSAPRFKSRRFESRRFESRSESRFKSRLIRSGTEEYRCTVDNRLLHCPTRFIFEVLKPSAFQKYSTSWVFSGFSCSRAISGIGWDGLDGLDGISVGGYSMSIALRC